MAWQVGDRIRSTLSGEADHYLIYCKGLEKIYSVHGDEFDESVSLRIGGCSENSSRAKLADDYSLENNWPPAVNPSGTTSATQLASKTVDTVETDGYTAEVPSDCDDGRTIIATREESELRLRAESAWLENGLLRFNVTAPADLYVIEHPEESEIYMIPDDAFESSISLRVEPPEKSSPRINYAEDFLFEKRWPPQEASG
ncbi:hypothetical protein EXE40_09460 [Halorubrum sp. GN11GM_10-3_MGM]|nr:hypothetical protein EXE40_09460 [Halorubrum sp. GN11GM_10-3_MGM]